MDINLDTYCSCSNCGQKAGSIRAIGKYVVELYPYVNEGEMKLLCISCMKEELKVDKKIYGDLDSPKKQSNFFEGLKSVYFKSFHLKK